MLFFLLTTMLLEVQTPPATPLPNIVLITVDTLRADRLSGYGYPQNTSPRLDALMAQGQRFKMARTIEPLTAPACISMLTALYPHQHGATRNGMPMFDNLQPFTQDLQNAGYQTAAFVGNWTLRNRLTGLGQFFEEYQEVFTRKRWFGLFLREANANDISEKARIWLSSRNPDKPFFLWLHYVEPHAPYIWHKEFAAQLGLPTHQKPSRSNRYNSEIAFVDQSIGRFLDHCHQISAPENTLVIFTSDHGESLGEHGYWGHGRNLFEHGLQIPLSFTWPGKIPSGTVSHEALLIDLPATILGLLNLNRKSFPQGVDWSSMLRGQTINPTPRTVFLQAHKGAVQSKAGVTRGRQKGLLEVAIIQDGIKEVWRTKSLTHYSYNLSNDPGETKSLVPKKSAPSEVLAKWALAVEKGLNKILDQQNTLGEKDLEMLRSLGYID